LATLEETAPEGDGWLHEVKFGGYRILGWIFDVTPPDQPERPDWTPRFRPIAEALRSVAREAILDGEIVALDERGASNCGTPAARPVWRRREGTSRLHGLRPAVDGRYDLRPWSLEECKAPLALLLAALPQQLER
jgi:bifunctional non-homologous end joining protein LigD